MPSKKPRSVKKSLWCRTPQCIVGMFVIFVACIMAVMLASTFIQKQRARSVAPVVTTTPESVVYPSTTQVVTSTAPVETGLVPYDQWVKENPLPVDSRIVSSVLVSVKWQRPVKVAKSVIPGLSDMVTLPNPYAEPYFKAGPYYRGQITDGILKGGKIYTYTTVEGEMQPSDVTYVDIIYNNKVIQVPYDGVITPDQFAQIQNAPTEQRTYILSRPKLSQTLTLTNGKLITALEGLSPTQTTDCYVDECTGLQKVASTKDGMNVFNAIGSHGDKKAIITEDGVWHTYVSALPFDSYEQGNGPVITNKTLWWTQEYASNTATYVRYLVGGCGLENPDNVLTTKEVSEQDLEAIGQTVSGDKIYGVKNYLTHPQTKFIYDQWYFPTDTGEKPDLAGFLKMYPVPFFIWKDAFGENVRYVIANAVAPAECGKPVIYLYPKETTKVTVKLSPTINVTKSEPTYPIQGWTVTANPNGQLTDANGQTYGSLFWEGTGVNYETPSTGFVIKDGEVDQQLAKILSAYGLNEKESAEFREFWVPKMTGANYYRVSFVETADWNKAAPMSVTPRPDSVIRIFMDWQKLTQPISIEAPKIVTPARTGFTLVEWGGLLRK